MTEAQLADDLELAGAGDRAAFQRVLFHYHSVLRGVLGRKIDGPWQRHIDPDDVLQDVYVSIYPRVADMEFEGPQHFYKWLERVALNQLADMKRALGRQKRDVLRVASCRVDPSTSYPDLLQRVAGNEPTPSRELIRDEIRDEITAAIVTSLARLSPDQRDVVRLRYVQRVPVQDIAVRLEKSETAVYALCHRGLKSLREILTGLTSSLRYN